MLILIFNSFYSLFILNPKDMSDQLQKMAFAVPGIRPGNQTAFYLKQTIKRVNLIGGVMLAILATLPNLLAALFNISNLNGLSTTSLLILVGVILELGRDIKNIYYSGIYTNLY
jgi:preprotein translocase subunit SecY